MAEHVGVPVSTVRHWDSIRVLSPRRRAGGGQRRYGTAEVERARLIAMYRAAGLELSEIRDRLRDEARRSADHYQAIAELLTRRIAADRQLLQAVEQLIDLVSSGRARTTPGEW